MDEGKSGKSVECRPQFKQMLSNIKNGKDDVDYVLVFKLSRFGRNTKFEEEIRKQIGSSIDTPELYREYDGLKYKLSQTTGVKNKLADQMEYLSVSDKNYDKK